MFCLPRDFNYFSFLTPLKGLSLLVFWSMNLPVSVSRLTQWPVLGLWVCDLPVTWPFLWPSPVGGLVAMIVSFIFHPAIGTFCWLNPAFHSAIGTFHWLNPVFHSAIGTFYWLNAKFDRMIGKFLFQTGNSKFQIPIPKFQIISKSQIMPKASLWDYDRNSECSETFCLEFRISVIVSLENPFRELLLSFFFFQKAGD